MRPISQAYTANKGLTQIKTNKIKKHVTFFGTHAMNGARPAAAATAFLSSSALHP